MVGSFYASVLPVSGIVLMRYALDFILYAPITFIMSNFHPIMHRCI